MSDVNLAVQLLQLGEWMVESEKKGLKFASDIINNRKWLEYLLLEEVDSRFFKKYLKEDNITACPYCGRKYKYYGALASHMQGVRAMLRNPEINSTIWKRFKKDFEYLRTLNNRKIENYLLRRDIIVLC